MAKDPEEWIKQAIYDYETAEALYKTGRYIYTIFMCHLSLEKALKGLYMKTTGEEPPKLHDLAFVMKQTTPQPPASVASFIQDLNSVSVPTRYPEDLERMLKDYDKKNTANVLKLTNEAIQWLKSLY